MDIPVDFWKLAAGLSIFLYGMFLLEDSVRIMSGKAFRQMIRFYTDGRLRSIGSGALITAILQSSSAVSLMVLAFVGAGVMAHGKRYWRNDGGQYRHHLDRMDCGCFWF